MTQKRIRLKFCLMGLPAFLGFVIFYIIPFVKSVGYSFIENTFSEKFVYFENYKTVFQNKYFRLAFTNTVIFSLVGVTVIVLLSLILSISLSKLSEKFSILKSAFVLPMVLPTASVIFFWQLLFDSDSYSAFTKIQSVGQFFEVLPIYLLFVWKNIGINIILITAALGKIPQSVYEAARLDGASNWKLSTKITFPLIIPTLFFVVMLSFVNSLKIFKESYLYYGTNYPPDSVYSIQYYMNNHFYKLNYQNLSTAVVIFTLTIAVLVFVLYKFENKFSESTF